MKKERKTERFWNEKAMEWNRQQKIDALTQLLCKNEPTALQQNRTKQKKTFQRATCETSILHCLRLTSFMEKKIFRPTHGTEISASVQHVLNRAHCADRLALGLRCQ